MGNIKSIISPVFVQSEKIKFSSLGYFFTMNIAVYLALHEVNLSYSTISEIWFVDMRYKYTFVGKRRDLIN